MSCMLCVCVIYIYIYAYRYIVHAMHTHIYQQELLVILDDHLSAVHVFSEGFVVQQLAIVVCLYLSTNVIF